ncbi:MAG: hypothetical protein P4L67_00740 [Candidatus Pacebacteria bacterium]|nr:hypothetical protein [Candidatus Paceibacterota bacterium]
MCGREQIAKREELKQQAKKEYEMEGVVIRDKVQKERRKIEGIKSEKLEEMQRVGIPDKFKVDLKKKKIC